MPPLDRVRDSRHYDMLWTHTHLLSVLHAQVARLRERRHGEHDGAEAELEVVAPEDPHQRQDALARPADALLATNDCANKMKMRLPPRDTDKGCAYNPPMYLLERARKRRVESATSRSP